jgi:hypothetical protein
MLLDKNKKIIHNLRLIIDHVIEPSNFNEENIAMRISEYLYEYK